MPSGHDLAGRSRSIEANLLEDTGPGSDDHCFHDLVGDHPRDRGTVDDRSGQVAVEPVRRFCDLYFDTATAAEQALTPAQFVLSRDHAHPPEQPLSFGDEATAVG